MSTVQRWRIAIAMVLCILGGMMGFFNTISVSASNGEQENYQRQEEIAKEQESDIIPYGEISGKKYSFAYDFKHYVNLSINASLSKPNITVHLSTTNSGGEDYIYFTAYKNKLFGGTKKGELKFKASGSSTKVMKLAKGNYSFRVRKSEKSPRKKAVMGTGWIKQN